MAKTLWWILWSALLVAGCRDAQPAVEEVRPVRTLTIGDNGGANAIELSGEVRARHEMALSFRIGGKLMARLVDTGARVNAGTVLARLDAQDVTLNVASVKAQLDAAKIDLAQLELNLQRSKELLNKKFVSQAEVDSRQSAVDAGRRKLEQAEAQLRLAQNQSTYATLMADSIGVVTAVDAEPGQVVAAGQSIVRVARDGEREVVVDVAEARRDEIVVGQTAQVRLWAGADRKVYSGKVREIAPAADAVTRTYRIRIGLANADDAVRLGMSATVNLLGKAATGVVVPLSAIYGQGDEQRVWRYANERVQSRKIQVLDSTSAGLKVAGLQSGDIVITAGAHLLREGQKVRLMSAAERKGL